MSQQDLNKSDHLLVDPPSSDANLHIEPCLTCRKVFLRPDMKFDDKTISLQGQEFLASVPDCKWQSDEELGTVSKSSNVPICRACDYESISLSSRNANFIMVESPGELYSHAQKDWHTDKSTSRYDFPEETSSPSCRMLASQWIDNCTQNHKKCCTDKISWLPTRLVDAGLDGGVVRLVETCQLSKDHYPPYFALSHMWGTETDHSRCLLSSNKSAWTKKIPVDQISASFQDAIQFTKDMSIPYIWIDSLCIIQDSSKYWSSEAALMDKVYAQSLCNIAASCASNKKAPDKGLFYTRTQNDMASLAVTHKSVIRSDYEGFYELSLDHNYIIDPGSFALYGRAWVLQEQLLSPRTIHFSEQLFWECRELRASETFPMGLSLMSYDSRDSILSKDWRSGLQDRGYIFWHNTLHQYMNSFLTYPSDRLVAIGAIAREYQTELNDIYLAGLWKKELPFNLLWTFGSGHSYPTRPKTYRCPTWSWASLDHSCPAIIANPAKLIGKALAKVVEAKVCSPPGRAYTEYHATYIRLEGKLYSILSEDAKKWLSNDERIYRNLLSLYSILYYPDISIPKSEVSRLHLFPIDSGINYSPIECLVLKALSVDNMEFERVGILTFSPLCSDSSVEPLRSISELALAQDPFLGNLDTITIF